MGAFPPYMPAQEDRPLLGDLILDVGLIAIVIYACCYFSGC